MLAIPVCRFLSQHILSIDELLRQGGRLHGLNRIKLVNVKKYEKLQFVQLNGSEEKSTADLPKSLIVEEVWTEKNNSLHNDYVQKFRCQGKVVPGISTDQFIQKDNL